MPYTPAKNTNARADLKSEQFHAICLHRCVLETIIVVCSLPAHVLVASTANNMDADQTAPLELADLSS